MTGLGNKVPAMLAQITGYDNERRTKTSMVSQSWEGVSRVCQGTDKSRILVIDDVCDSGDSLKKLHDYLPGVDAVYLYMKHESQQVKHFVRRYPKDRWIVFPSEERTVAVLPFLAIVFPRPYKQAVT